MPENDVLTFFRERSPQLKNVPDTELKQFIKEKYPQFAKDLTFPSVRERAQANIKSIESGPAKAQYERAQKSASQDIATYEGRVVKDVMLAGAAAAAAPFTAGASLPTAAAIMFGTGATASLAAEGVKKVMGSKEVADSFGDLAWTVGFDAATFAGAEAGGRAIGAFAKKALPQMIMRSAGKVGRAGDALEKMSERTLYGLEGRIDASVGFKGPAGRLTKDVDIGGILKRTENRIAELPVGRGEFGEQFASPRAPTKEVAGKIERGIQARRDIPLLERQLKTATSRAEKAGTAVEETKSATGYDYAVRQKRKAEADALVERIAGKLEAAKGADSTRQPLDVLVTIKGDAQQFAYNHPAWREGRIFKRMAEEMDATIRANLKPGDETELYNHYNTIMKARMDRTKVLDFSNKFVNFAAKRIVGSAIGGGVGYGIGGREGAAAGAVLGVAAPNISAFLLEQTLKNPQSRVLLKKAVNTWIEGSEGEANLLARRAFITAGGRQIVKDAYKAMTARSDAGVE